MEEWRDKEKPEEWTGQRLIKAELDDGPSWRQGSKEPRWRPMGQRVQMESGAQLLEAETGEPLGLVELVVRSTDAVPHME